MAMATLRAHSALANMLTDLLDAPIASVIGTIRHNRPAIEAVAELLIQCLDALDGDADLEDDGTGAEDDDPAEDGDPGEDDGTGEDRFPPFWADNQENVIRVRFWTAAT